MNNETFARNDSKNHRQPQIQTLLCYKVQVIKTGPWIAKIRVKKGVL